MQPQRRPGLHVCAPPPPPPPRCPAPHLPHALRRRLPPAAGLCGLSMGGVHANMAAALYPSPVALAPLLSPRSAAGAYCSGALYHATAWSQVGGGLLCWLVAFTACITEKEPATQTQGQRGARSRPDLGVWAAGWARAERLSLSLSLSLSLALALSSSRRAQAALRRRSTAVRARWSRATPRQLVLGPKP